MIANAKGANVAKFRVGYQPIAIKANWERDLCLLKFDDLPFEPVKLRDSASLQYEEPVFSLGFPIGQNVPQPSYGSIKAAYPYQNSLIIRSDAAFGLGSSGGALFDEQMNLIGITTFKSPGNKGYFYHLPVEWIKELMKAPDTHSLATNDIPFWALPIEQQPAFMKVVIPYQNEDWQALKTIAQEWTNEEPQSADAWYYLGVSEEGKGNLSLAEKYLNKAVSLNSRELDALIALSRVAFHEKDIKTLSALEAPVRELDNAQADSIASRLKQLSENTCLIQIC